MACVRAAQDGQLDATTMPWLMGVARHKLIDHYRRRTREDRKLSLAWSADPVVESFLDADVTDAVALDALQALAPLHRLVLMLRYVDEARLPAALKQLVRLSVPIAAILMPLAFFLSVLSPNATEPNGLIALAYAGAVLVAAGVFILGVGLLRSSSPSKS